jgi:adenylate cyclase class 2
MTTTEIEVKFYLTNYESVRKRLLALGAHSKGRSFETNVRYEDDHHTLIQKKALLRLRQDTKTRLTYKSEPALKDNHFKVCRELEVEVSDFSTMNLILESLGFKKAQIYEKWRESFTLNKTSFCIDNMPFGNFLEIEGERKSIRDHAFEIGMDWDKRIILNYLEIFNVLKRKLNLTFTDLTFDNFAHIRFDPAEYLYLFEAGNG